MRCSLVLAALLALSAALTIAAADAPAPGAPSPEALRIVQLETQVASLSTDLAVCRAQTALAQQPQAAQQLAKKRADLEHACGGSIDWNATPPICKEKR